MALEDTLDTAGKGIMFLIGIPLAIAVIVVVVPFLLLFWPVGKLIEKLEDKGWL